MSENNNYNQENPDRLPKPKHLGEDFKEWLQISNKQNIYLKKREAGNTGDKLSLLKDEIKTSEKYSVEVENIDKNVSPGDNKYTQGGNTVFTEKLLTRNASDSGKGPLNAINDTFKVFGNFFGDIGSDAVEILRHPIQTSKDTMAMLDKDNSDIKQI